MQIPGFTAEVSILKQRKHRVFSPLFQPTRKDAEAPMMSVRPAFEWYCSGNLCCYWNAWGGFMGCFRRQ